MKLSRILLIWTITISLSLAILPPSTDAQRQLRKPRISKADQAALDRISASTLLDHLSFIASDQLEGRDSPSIGLNIASEYIAKHFKQAGLEAIGDDGYFQTATVIQIPQPEGFSLTIKWRGASLNVAADQVSLIAETPVEISDANLYKLSAQDPAKFASIASDQVTGQVILIERGNGWGPLLRLLPVLRPAFVLIMDSQLIGGPAVAKHRLIDFDEEKLEHAASDVPFLRINNPQVFEMFKDMAPGMTDAKLSLHAQSSVPKAVKLRNVVGLLRGSDPVLRNTYVLVTAHYDHLGVDGSGRIYNGANDNGSGTVSVMELASALSAKAGRLKRSVVFITFFGEEKGEVGSKYYVRHPILPLEKTIAVVNLEQLGRTDSLEGPQIASATVTGFDFSDATAAFKAAGKITGIRIYKHELFSDRYFLRSDNGPFAESGIPAHTIGVLFQYPDYHALGDKANKIDYDNMAKVNRMLALALIRLANAHTIPKWNERNVQTAVYVEAWKKRHPSKAQ